MNRLLPGLTSLLIVIILSAQPIMAQDSTGGNKNVVDSLAFEEAVKIDSASTASKNTTPKTANELSTESYYETLTIAETNYELCVFRNSSGNFNVQVKTAYESTGTDSTVTKTGKLERSTINLNENFGFSEFKSIVLELLKRITNADTTTKNLAGDPLFENKISSIYTSIQQKIKLQNDPAVQGLRDRMSLYEQELDERYRYAGELTIKERVVNTYERPHNQKGSFKKTPSKFILDSVYVSLFNSTVDKFLLYGRCKVYDPRRFRYSYQVTGKTYNQTFSMNGLNNNDYFIKLANSDSLDYFVKINELLYYGPHKDNENSAIVKDQAFWLKYPMQKNVPLARRTLYDYLSLITFVDFLGVNDKLNNNFIQIEGRARFPLVLSTLAKPRMLRNMTILPMFETFLNASFVNGNNVGGRRGEIFHDTTGGKDILFYDNFDLLRNYNIKAGFSAAATSFRYKDIHSRIYLTYDLKMYRTSFNYNNYKPGADSIVQSNLFSISHGPSLLIEYRPDFNVGADLRFSAEFNLNPFSGENNGLNYLPGRGPVYKDDAANPYRYTRITNKQKNVYGWS